MCRRQQPIADTGDLPTELLQDYARVSHVGAAVVLYQCCCASSQQQRRLAVFAEKFLFEAQGAMRRRSHSYRFPFLTAGLCRAPASTTRIYPQRNPFSEEGKECLVTVRLAERNLLFTATARHYDLDDWSVWRASFGPVEWGKWEVLAWREMPEPWENVNE